MADFFYRTEDIRPDEVEGYFVETQKDREIINALKNRNPVVLVGSRGVGKSFLLRVAEYEMLGSLENDGVFPVYLSFSRSSLINTSDVQQFQHWMLSRICSKIVRDLKKAGYILASSPAIKTLTGGGLDPNIDQKTPIEKLADQFEDSWKNADVDIDASILPTVDDFRDSVAEICLDLNIKKIVVLIDEAAHILLPEQQRQFFTLFRDLRSPYLACKAAVYPGVTSYGDTFQPSHDATMLFFERDILGSNYVETMKEIVEKQADSRLQGNIAKNGANFAVLAYCASGNPRVLLKTLSQAPRVSSSQVNEVIREYYRTQLWSEHSTLPEKYEGHRHLIDWGRKFVEGIVLPDLQSKNLQYLDQEKQTTCFFWVHRDSPQAVKESLKLLAYSGIVNEHASGIRATRSEIGTRYAVNLGALISQESSPTVTGLDIARNLTPKRMVEFGINHVAYQSLSNEGQDFNEPNVADVLQQQLERSISVLDITEWQRGKLKELGLNTIGEVLLASESSLQKLAYVGEKRSRRMRNAALAAVFEYLSG
ncbi:MAG: hypothetical protein H2067_18490 [Alcanivorax sp.]|nr:hypothetical protein [Alcanivorax sp.]